MTNTKPTESGEKKHEELLPIAVHVVERFLLLLSGSAMLGTWVAMVIRSLSDRYPLCELAAHPSLHLWSFIASFQLLNLWMWILRRKSSFSGDRWRRRFWVTCIPLFFFSWVTTPWTLLPLHVSEKATDSLKIFSWNVQKSNENTAQLIELVKQQNPDVIAFIEVSPFVASHIDELKELYPFNLILPHNDSGGIAMLSRLPGSEFRVIKPGNHWMPAIEMKVSRSLQQRPDLSLLAVHTFSPGPDESTRTIHRDQQLQGIAEWAASQTAAVAVVGDFNITPWSPPFWRMLEVGKLRDAASYRGYFPSWPAGLGLAAIPIDHALVNQSIQILDRTVLPDTFQSDHRPITVTIR